MVKWVKISKTEKALEIQPVRPTEVCDSGKASSEKNDEKSVKTPMLLSNVIDADHRNSCLFTFIGFNWCFGSIS